jgi:antitoxin MazE
VGERTFGIDRDRRRARALARIRSFREKLPPDWKFDPQEANAR